MNAREKSNQLCSQMPNTKPGSPRNTNTFAINHQISPVPRSLQPNSFLMSSTKPAPLQQSVQKQPYSSFIQPSIKSSGKVPATPKGLEQPRLRATAGPKDYQELHRNREEAVKKMLGPKPAKLRDFPQK